MELIDFIDDSEPAVSAEILNKLQKNVKTAIEDAELRVREELETETQERENAESGLLSKINGKCFYLGDIALTYLNQTTLSATVTMPGLGSIINKSMILLSCAALNGTPYDTVNNLTYKTEGDNLIVYAHAPGFVGGHVLSVKVMVYYNG